LSWKIFLNLFFWYVPKNVLPGGTHCIYLKTRDYKSANHVWCLPKLYSNDIYIYLNPRTDEQGFLDIFLFTTFIRYKCARHKLTSFPLESSLVQLFMYLNHKNLHRVHIRNQAKISTFPMFKKPMARTDKRHFRPWTQHFVSASLSQACDHKSWTNTISGQSRCVWVLQSM
jgi:hypothetical protein